MDGGLNLTNDQRRKLSELAAVYKPREKEVIDWLKYTLRVHCRSDHSAYSFINKLLSPNGNRNPDLRALAVSIRLVAHPRTPLPGIDLTMKSLSTALECRYEVVKLLGPQADDAHNQWNESLQYVQDRLKLLPSDAVVETSNDTARRTKNQKRDKSRKRKIEQLEKRAVDAELRAMDADCCLLQLHLKPRGKITTRDETFQTEATANAQVQMLREANQKLQLEADEAQASLRKAQQDAEARRKRDQAEIEHANNNTAAAVRVAEAKQVEIDGLRKELNGNWAELKKDVRELRELERQWWQAISRLGAVAASIALVLATICLSVYMTGTL